MIRRHAQPAMGVGGFAVGVAGGLCDPGSVAGAQNGFESGYQTTWGNRPGYGISFTNVLVRLAVGDHEQAAPFQRILHGNPQPLGSPQRLGGFAEARFFLGRRAGCIQAGRQPRRLVRQGLKDLLVWKPAVHRNLSGAQVVQPVRHLLKGFSQAPANNEHGDQGDQQHLHRDASQSVPPDGRPARVHVGDIVKNGNGADYPVLLRA